MLLISFDDTIYLTII